MGILTKLDEKYRKYDDWKIEELRYDNDPYYDYYDELVEAFEEDMRNELANLSVEERMEVFESILIEAKNELEDHCVEKYAGKSVQLLLLIQLVSQVVNT